MLPVLSLSLFLESFEKDLNEKGKKHGDEMGDDQFSSMLTHG